MTHFEKLLFVAEVTFKANNETLEKDVKYVQS